MRSGWSIHGKTRCRSVPVRSLVRMLSIRPVVATVAEPSPGPAGVGRTASLRGCVRHGGRLAEECGDERLGLNLDPLEMRAIPKAFGVELVDVLRARRSNGKPPVVGDDLQTAQRRSTG